MNLDLEASRSAGAEMEKPCTRCGVSKPDTRIFFGGTPSGGRKNFCRECERIASKAYESKNKDRRALRDQKRAAATGGFRRSFPIELKRALFKKQGGVCICCFDPMTNWEDGEVDHAKPLAKGGSDDASNLFLVHKQCNKEKHNKLLTEHWDWRVTHGLDRENLGIKNGLFDYFIKLERGGE